MAAVVATMVVRPLVKLVMDKVSSGLLDQYKVMNGMEEQHEILKRKLPAILDVITDAEQAAAHREGAAAWLEAIKKVVYQANEVLDEFKYEALRRQAKEKGQYKELGFNVVKLFPTHNHFVFRNRMGRKLNKIVQAIEVLVTEMNAFGFKYQQQPPLSKQWRQTDHVIFDPKRITSRSRANDNKNIVDLLIGQANNADLTVVPIVGMGGLGKTTLAQLVYNEPVVQKHFDLLLWMCVSDCFDVESLAKSIVEAAPRKKDDGPEAAASKKNDGGTKAVASKKVPLESLQNVVSGQRYLLVLDDVWKREVDKWEELKSCLQHGGLGSVVLTTTRDEGVAEMMGTVEAYNLTALEDKFIKEIIETRAFSYLHKEEERPGVLINMVGEIVKRCAGSPLVATALGSILRTKTSEEEWKAVSSRSNICTEESGILPILKLSYNDLPSHMKQCFAFCAIFPKDYEIDVNKLIQLWIAHGFIIQEKQVRLETVGKQIFNELASRSFFYDVKQVQTTVKEIEHVGLYHSISTTCKIHDLMHDVALSVMEKECALATGEPSLSEWLQTTARHLFISCKEPEKKLNSYMKNNSLAIRTLLCDSYMDSSLQHLSKYSSLQALQLCSRKSSFPLEPKHLHHLRYLDISRSNVTTLPEDMSILYNLQMLNLSGCRYLCGLPRQMKYMTALRHLYTHDCPNLKSMPRDLGKLTSLQTLTCFPAGSSSNCGNVGELGHLNLGGKLDLHFLANVTEEEAEAANLMKKKELRDLTLTWSSGYYGCENDARVLEKLKPHDGLHAIKIQSYGATNPPTWMAMLKNIVEIHLIHCHKLQWLFSCDLDMSSFAFPNLKELTLEGLLCLERWWETEYDGMQGEVVMFPRLEKLSISRCEILAALPGHPTFPNLQNVCIKRCPKLTITFPKSLKLTVFTMEGYEPELFLWVARHMTSLTNLELNSLGNSTGTTSAVAEHGLRLVAAKGNCSDLDFPLAVLVLRGFNSGVAELCAYFVHLQYFSILSSDALVHWPEKEFQGLVSLRKLEIFFCNRLSGYARAPAEQPTSSQTRQLLPCLESLSITCCESLVEVFNVPPSLREMHINGCTKLESIYGRRLQQGQSAAPICQGASSIQEVSSSSSSPVAAAEHLEVLKLLCCPGLKGVLHLPPSLKKLEITSCNGLTSLESLPDGPEAYSSLQYLTIRYCPGIKTLPTSMQQRLGSLQWEDITLGVPKTRHYYGSTLRVRLDAKKHPIRPRCIQTSRV